jgi:hypothetical protein
MRKSNFGDVYQTAILAATELSGEPSSATDPDELGPDAAARASSLKRRVNWLNLWDEAHAPSRMFGLNQPRLARSAS